MRKLGLLFLLACAGPMTTKPPTPPAPTPDPDADPHLWLEDVTGDRALDWVRAQNARSTAELAADPRFEALRRRLLAIYDSRDKIPYPTRLGAHVYNFWQDQSHVRGILRRTTMESFAGATPSWETVLDVDALAASEKENWVYAGYLPLHPDYKRCLLFLSRGGGDAHLVREFDLEQKAFVPGGFALAEAKSDVSWRDRDTIYVGTDFGPGSLTTSGYPRVVKEWKRGTPLAAARTVYEAKPADLAAGASVIHDRGRTYELIARAITFYTNETFLRRGDAWVKIDKPDDATVSTFDDQILITLRSAWQVGGKTWPAGALLATGLEAYLRGERELAMLFEPTPRKSLAGVSGTRRHLLVNELENVRNRLWALEKTAAGWQRRPLAAPGLGTVSAWGVDPDHSDDYWLTVTDFLTPSSLAHGTIGREPARVWKTLPAFFDARGLRIEQFEATSRDGTRIPYFQVSRAALALDGQNPTLLEGYGGFEVPMLSGYDATAGAGWMERGGVFVMANIRGGGEFGPAWHQAALKADRQRAYDDFIAVAEDLVRRRVTSPPRLAAIGGSNGGLLMGNMLVQRPDLFGAIVCQVPLLDMRRYHRLLAGASWMGEYGDPDSSDWQFLRRYSPYHLVEAGRRYPRLLVTTSTRDDRVHPGHARKMVAKMVAQGHDVLYYENIEGGHGGAANNPQRAHMNALAYTFLARQLELP